MREKVFENKIKAYLNERGHWNVKFFANSYTRAGIPDILACICGRFVAIEVKNEVGRLSSLQERELKQITKSEGYAIVLRPKDFEWFKQFVEGIENGHEIQL